MKNKLTLGDVYRWMALHLLSFIKNMILREKKKKMNCRQQEPVKHFHYKNRPMQYTKVFKVVKVKIFNRKCLLFLAHLSRRLTR